jgi:uncharacterized membrane protein YcaP (DUF421 family)
MKPEEFKMWDWQRIFIGEVPGAFLIETVLRVTILYIILIVSMRLLGKRMSSQLSRNELAAMVSLAAAIGVPILAPDRGLIPAIIIAIIVVSISKGVSYLTATNPKVEPVTQGRLDTLVSDSTINIKAMTKTRIPKERILAELRTASIKHLGEVERLYMEANGSFTIIKKDKPEPGLPVIPYVDPEFLQELKPAGKHVCHFCGKRKESNQPDEACSNCNNTEWTQAVA